MFSFNFYLQVSIGRFILLLVFLDAQLLDFGGNNVLGYCLFDYIFNLTSA